MLERKLKAANSKNARQQDQYSTINHTLAETQRKLEEATALSAKFKALSTTHESLQKHVATMKGRHRDECDEFKQAQYASDESNKMLRNKLKALSATHKSLQKHVSNVTNGHKVKFDALAAKHGKVLNKCKKLKEDLAAKVAAVNKSRSKGFKKLQQELSRQIREIKEKDQGMASLKKGHDKVLKRANAKDKELSAMKDALSAKEKKIVELSARIEVLAVKGNESYALKMKLESMATKYMNDMQALREAHAALATRKADFIDTEPRRRGAGDGGVRTLVASEDEMESQPKTNPLHADAGVACKADTVDIDCANSQEETVCVSADSQVEDSYDEVKDKQESLVPTGNAEDIAVDSSDLEIAEDISEDEYGQEEFMDSEGQVDDSYAGKEHV